MPSLIAIKKFISSKGLWILGIVVIACSLMTLSYCTGHKSGKSSEVIKQQDRTIKVQGQVNTADNKAADQRVKDEIKFHEQAQEIKDAIINAQSVDDARVRRGCVILRQQGRSTDSIPACRGLGAGN